jgi:hypothetical protein
MSLLFSSSSERGECDIISDNCWDIQLLSVQVSDTTPVEFGFV